MKVPKDLSEAFGEEFQTFFSEFLHQFSWIPEPQSLLSDRFLSRSVLPHIIKLSDLFNRMGDEQKKGLDQYWNQSSNPKNLRLAYNLYFMPSNLFRVASVFSELLTYGMSFPKDTQLLELGTGPGAGLAGFLASLKYSSGHKPDQIKAALVEQDVKQLKFAEQFIESYHEFLDTNTQLTINPFRRKIDLSSGLLPERAPQFDVILMSFFLNEFDEENQEIQSQISKLFHKHLNENGVIVIIEPALKQQSRKLLHLRKLLIASHKKDENFKVLLPCLGSQNCGAFAKEEDWCHEEVSWWRPPYFRVIDKKANLDRKSLPFSYLVISKSKQSLDEILPNLPGKKASRSRLVSPLHKVKNRVEFFVCDEKEKRRITQAKKNTDLELIRGDITTLDQD